MAGAPEFHFIRMKISKGVTWHIAKNGSYRPLCGQPYTNWRWQIFVGSDWSILKEFIETKTVISSEKVCRRCAMLANKAQKS